MEKIGVGEYVQVNGRMRWRSVLRWHDLRHTYASILISQGENVVYVCRQLRSSLRRLPRSAQGITRVAVADPRGGLPRCVHPQRERGPTVQGTTKRQRAERSVQKRRARLPVVRMLMSLGPSGSVTACR